MSLSSIKCHRPLIAAALLLGLASSNAQAAGTISMCLADYYAANATTIAAIQADAKSCSDPQKKRTCLIQAARKHKGELLQNLVTLEACLNLPAGSVISNIPTP